MTTETSLDRRGAQDPALAERTWSGRYYTPSVDILESEGELTLLADMPGVAAGDVDIRFENGELSIHGKVASHRDADLRYLLLEYEEGSYYRSFRISETIDAERISADYRDGVLMLHLPKAERAKPRKITVKGS
jgi:HSP20 family protein